MSESQVLSKGQILLLEEKLRGLMAGKSSSQIQAKKQRSIPELGIIFFSGLGKAKNLYDLIIRVSQFADQNNFNAIWTPERHFTEVGGAYPNPSVLAAALSTITKNIRLRSGSINLPLHDPIRVAEEWAVVDNLSGGRVDLAIAPGWHVKDFVLKPENFSNKSDVFNESKDLLQKLWRGESVEKKDANGNTQSILTYPRPIQKNLPIWLTTSLKEAAWEFAGKNNFNVLSALINFGPKELEKRIAIYRQARLSAGLNPMEGKVSLMLHTYVDQTQELAIQKVKQPLTEYLKSFVTQHQTANTNANEKVKTLNMLGNQNDEFVELVFDRYTKSSSLIGDRDHARQVLSNFKDMGVDEVACLIDFGVQEEEIMQSLNLLSTLMRES